MLIRYSHASAHRIFGLAAQSRRGNRAGYLAIPVFTNLSTKGSKMAMRLSKASTANITTEIQAEGEFDLTLMLVIENAANGGVSMKFANDTTHKWYNNRMGSDQALDNLDTVAFALGLNGWDDENPVESFKNGIGAKVRVTIVSKRSNGQMYYNIAKIIKTEAKASGAKGQRQAKSGGKPFDDDDIPF